MLVNCVIHSFLCCLIFSSVNSDENSEDDYIEFTLLLHCKLETKKNAREIKHSGVLEFLDEFRMITFFLSSSIITDLLIFSQNYSSLFIPFGIEFKSNSKDDIKSRKI